MISLRDVVTGFGNRDPLAEVWRRSLRGGGGGAAEITGVPPLRYIGNGKPLTDYLISGNTVQDGTPSPDAPVDATGCGVRTDNLLYGDVANGMIVPCFLKKGAVYTCSLTADGTISGTPPQIILYDKEKKRSDYWTLTNYNNIRLWRSFRPIDDVYYAQIRANDTTGIRDVTVASGNEKYSFIPYGYKLPMTVNGTEYPIYLGAVPTTRRIKKLVLTGEENISYASSDENRVVGVFVIPNTGMEIAAVGYCNILQWKHHYLPSDYNRIVASGNNVFYLSLAKAILPEPTIDGLKSYLAQQYAAGTPVTVWYVLAEPETAIVNEPLMKIGDYADTVSFAQAGVTIPTVSGANVLDVPTEVPPSEITIKGGISSV